MLLESADVGELLGVSAERVRQLASAGRIPTCAKTPSGRRLYLRADVEHLAAERARNLRLACGEDPGDLVADRRCDECGASYGPGRAGEDVWCCNAPGCGGTVRAVRP